MRQGVFHVQDLIGLYPGFAIGAVTETGGIGFIGKVGLYLKPDPGEEKLK